MAYSPNTGTFKALSPKAAIFARGFVEHLATSPIGSLPLRKCQDHGVAALADAGETISVPYISKLTVALENLQLVTKQKAGKHYMAYKGDPLVWDSFILLLEGDFGTSMEASIPDEVVAERSKILDFMGEHCAVRITESEPLSKPMYQVLMEKFRAGKLDMVFVDTDRKMLFKDGGRSSYQVPFFSDDESLSASVGDE